MGQRRKFTNGYDLKPLTDDEALKIANGVMKDDWFYLRDYYSGTANVYFPFSSDGHDTRVLKVERATQKRFVKAPKEIIEELRTAERKTLASLSDKLYEWG